jgi:hypothetical protein
LVSQLVHLAVSRGSPNPISSIQDAIRLGSPNPISSIQDAIRFPDIIHTAKMEADHGYSPAQRVFILRLANLRRASQQFPRPRAARKVTCYQLRCRRGVYFKEAVWLVTV